MTLALAAEMLLSSGLAATHQEATARAQDALSSGKAAEVFGRMVAALGGPADFMEACNRYLPEAKVVRPVKATRAGFVTAIDSRAIGIAVVTLGGGRTRPEDAIDHSVGISAILPVGAEVSLGDRLAKIHAASVADADAAEEAIRSAYVIGESRPRINSPVLRRITAHD